MVNSNTHCLSAMNLKLLKTIRQNQYRSQEDLASVIGIETSTLSRWENGSRSPSFHNFINWVNALGYVVSIENVQQK
tara:strand:+ start:1030 stop:1260 length:231 start_codon:yes stop_codon:yes gene_type:complete